MNYRSRHLVGRRAIRAARRTGIDANAALGRQALIARTIGGHEL
jgi:hypothetical protein